MFRRVRSTLGHIGMKETKIMHASLQQIKVLSRTKRSFNTYIYIARLPVSTSPGELRMFASPGELRMSTSLFEQRVFTCAGKLRVSMSSGKLRVFTSYAWLRPRVRGWCARSRCAGAMRIRTIARETLEHTTPSWWEQPWKQKCFASSFHKKPDTVAAKSSGVKAYYVDTPTSTDYLNPESQQTHDRTGASRTLRGITFH